MRSEIESPTEPFRRLHPLSLLFGVTSIIRRFLVPGAIAFFAGGSRDGNYEIWAMVLAGPALGYSLIKYISLRYRFGDSEFIIREGIFEKTERHVPYQRIQNVDTTRNVLHRLFGMSDVVIQTASGTKPEATLSVLSLKAADELRARIFAGRQAASDAAVLPEGADASMDAGTAGKPQLGDPPPDGAPVAVSGGTPVGESHLPAYGSTSPQPGSTEGAAHVVGRSSLADLVVFGVISNRGMIVVGAFFGLLWQLDLMPSWDRVEQVSGSAISIEQWTAVLKVLAGVGLLIAAIVALRLLSIGLAIVSLYDFTLTRNGDELRTRFGLLTQHTTTIPRGRIQLVDVEATLLHRVFGRVAVRARTAGSAAVGKSGPGRNWVMPVWRPDRLAALFSEVQPEIGFEEAAWRGVDPRGKRRLFKRSIALAVVPCAGATYQWPLWGALGSAAILAISAAYAHLTIKHTAYALTGHTVWLRSGWLGRTWRAVRFGKVQAVTLVESPFDRRHAMASVRIDTANAGIGQDAIVIPFLSRALAEDIHERISIEAAGTEFRW